MVYIIYRVLYNIACCNIFIFIHTKVILLCMNKLRIISPMFVLLPVTKYLVRVVFGPAGPKISVILVPPDHFDSGPNISDIFGPGIILIASALCIIILLS